MKKALEYWDMLRKWTDRSGHQHAVSHRPQRVSVSCPIGLSFAGRDHRGYRTA